VAAVAAVRLLTRAPPRQIRSQERELQGREAALQAAQANGASGASTASAGASEGEADEGRSALDNIEAGRIRFAELTMGRCSPPPTSRAARRAYARPCL
jgi:hypothetical protein